MLHTGIDVNPQRLCRNVVRSRSLTVLKCLMTLQIISFVDAQHMIGRSLVLGKIYVGFARFGLLSSSWKYSIHIFFCPSSSPPLLLLTGLSYLACFASILLVVEYSFLVLF
ncbi:hypothetical protein DPMN_069832 [Dreissena polymorpha]|uniref:Uncharacterized protein n=1 Tax=Dreissena polymorpha TaxID=45954 RepID=A0A9D3YZW9_DREPO|nr:hypothetical protein DPMN_069832 [Dreissena polymorpha]